jgi:geranyl-CoA carboxylase alpha subunit
MGDKARARAAMEYSGVPCVPGFHGDDPDDATLIAAAPSVGVPLLVKAAAGGGGRGMRRVDHLSALPAALAAARAEARHAFGDGSVLLERLVTGARHVELQIVADAHGAVIHLGERDCSVQRRHQKVVEEAPSPAVDEELRHRMGAAAVAAAAAVDYVGVGTVEFLLAADGAFYFLEMNTRIQVEHPVTEAITGLDLVALQLQIAEGLPLPLSQGDVCFDGHAIEVRLYAEDPAEGYRPRTGTLVAFQPPTGPGVRVDHGLCAPCEITAHYDPMIAKIIAWGTDRQEARRRLLRALRETVLVGLTTNRRLLSRILAHPDFVQGDVTTSFLDEHAELASAPEPVAEARLVAAALLLEGKGGFQSSHLRPRKLVFSLNGQRTEVSVVFTATGLDIDRHSVQLRRTPGGRCRVRIDGIEQTVVTGEGWAQLAGEGMVFGPWTPMAAAAVVVEGDGQVRAPTAGRVLAVPVKLGDRVDEETIVVVVEAMKLETSLRAGTAGTVESVRVDVGDTVSAGQIVVVVAKEDE